MLTNIWIFIYIIIGFIVSIYVWNKKYNSEYIALKKIDMADDSMAVLFMMYMVIFWPIVLTQYIYFKNKNN